MGRQTRKPTTPRSTIPETDIVAATPPPVLAVGLSRMPGLINTTDLFNALINWVENGTYPNSIVAYTGQTIPATLP